MKHIKNDEIRTMTMMSEEDRGLLDDEEIDCDNCTLRKYYAKRFDEHWLGKDDCPLKCELAQHVQGLDGLLSLIGKEVTP